MVHCLKKNVRNLKASVKLNEKVEKDEVETERYDNVNKIRPLVKVAYASCDPEGHGPLPK